MTEKKPKAKAKPKKKAAAKKTVKKKEGRPTKYKPEYCEKAYKLCLLSATDAQMADFFEVAESTFHKWKLDFPEFSEALKKGKLIADAEVADSLIKRALGYSHTETKVFNNNGEILTHDVTKHYPPDATAIAYWLNNRQKENWRQRQEQTVQAAEGVSFNMNFSSDAD